MPVEELVFTLNISSLFMTNPPRRLAKEKPGGPHPMTREESTARHLPSAGGTTWSLIPGEICLLAFPFISMVAWLAREFHNDVVSG